MIIEGTTVETDATGKLKIGFRVGGQITYIERFPAELANTLINQLDEAQTAAHRERVVATLT